MTALTAAIDSAIDDERLRRATPCQCVAEVRRVVYADDGTCWRCRCQSCGHSWLVTRRPGDGA